VVEAEHSPLLIGARVRLRRADLPEAGSYSTRVEDFDGERIALQPFMLQGLPVTLPKGTRVELEFMRTQPPGEGLYRAETEELGKTAAPLNLLVLRSPERWQRVQARQYFRVPAVLPVQLRDAGEDGAPWMIGQTRDISGGGCQLVVGQPFAVDQLLELVIFLPGQRVAAKGSVRRAEPLAETGKQWTLGIAFAEITERDRDAVIRFALQRQIELRRKGMA